MTDIFILLVIYQLKHFIADFPLQTRYMLGKFKPDLGFILPLMSHCVVHALFTFSICFWFLRGNHLNYCLGFSLFDFTIHFIQDRIKASPRLFGQFKPNQQQFWLALGQDQMTHHLTHYAIIYYVVILKGTL